MAELTLYGTGLQFPTEVSDKGRLVRVGLIEKVKASWLFLLDTAKGSVFYEKDMGLDLDALIFKGPNEVQEAQAEYEVKIQLEKWEKRALVDKVLFAFPEPGKIQIQPHGILVGNGQPFFVTKTYTNS